ncbi:MAG: tetratricopeptide repeat protein [Anaerolineae bacterium]|nr:tetratricopeptide repeat protein [Anaerolineae bacterium]
MSVFRPQVSGIKCPGLRVKSWGLGLTILMVVSLLVAVVPVVAQTEVSPTEAMLRANQSYEAGQYAGAIAIYEAIVEAGIESSEVYYNLGNAYFKQGDLGRAILNYRRAQRITPRDADIATNLNFSRTQTIDQFEGEAELTNMVQVAEQWLTLNEAAVLALILWVLFCYFVVLAILAPRLRRVFGWMATVLALFLVIGLISTINRLYTDWQYPPAVIITQEVDITSGPGGADQYLVEFSLHAGTEVRILESRPGWQRITLPGDLQGWVPAEAVVEVIK